MRHEKKYEHREPFLSVVDIRGDTFLKVRQATEQGYTLVPVWGGVDLAYPSSLYRRARTIDNGRLVNALNCTTVNSIFVEL